MCVCACGAVFCFAGPALIAIAARIRGRQSGAPLRRPQRERCATRPADAPTARPTRRTLRPCRSKTGRVGRPRSLRRALAGGGAWASPSTKVPASAAPSAKRDRCSTSSPRHFGGTALVAVPSCSRARPAWRASLRSCPPLFCGAGLAGGQAEGG